MMEKKFQMSMIGELTFFLGIQVKQMKQGTFVHQTKYTKDLMKKFNMAELKLVSTLMSTATSLGPDEDGEAIDQREYMSMIGSLLYLTAHGRTLSSSCAFVRIFSFPTLFTSDDSSVNLQISQTHTQVWGLLFCFFFVGSCRLF
jgi:hypothetical protein